MKVALVYDRINKIGGAERVLLALHQIWPDAPLYTSVYDSTRAPWARDFKVITSFAQRLPAIKRHHEWFAWLMPLAFESFDFAGYDVVISVTSAEAKGIITRPETLHLCYLLTPSRYLWSHSHFYQQGSYATNKNWLTRKLTPIIFSSLRRWDYLAAQRPDQIIAISKTVADRCRKYYHRQVSKIIYPPVSLLSVKPDTSLKVPKNYYLLVSRLVPYKRVDLAIKAFNQLHKNLIIIGEGAQRAYLKKLAGPTVKLIGRVGEQKLARYYQKCQALVFPAEEDFGIVCLEAQQFGKPVIAYAKGGAAETVVPGTGVLFQRPTVTALSKAVHKVESTLFDPTACLQNTDRFSLDKFTLQFKSYVEDQWYKTHPKP